MYSYLFRKLNTLGASNNGKTFHQINAYLSSFQDNLFPSAPHLIQALQGLINKSKVMLDEPNGLYYLL